MIFQATWLNTSHDLTKSALFTLLYLSVHCFLEMLVSLTLLLFAIDLTALAHYTTVFPNIPLNCLQQIHNFVSPAVVRVPKFFYRAYQYHRCSEISTFGLKLVKFLNANSCHLHTKLSTLLNLPGMLHMVQIHRVPKLAIPLQIS